MRERPAHVPILIVGSGFSGLGLSIRLARTGRRDSLVIERARDVGGTWRDNTYPGATCDVPSHLYSFSFAPNPNWSKSFSSQWEIQVYLRQLARECAPLDRYLFDCELLAASWDAAAGAWTVETSRGTFTATILVTAFGGLCEPKLPDVPGIDCFGGELFHSARWNHDYDLTSRRVAVIGTGASAVQIVPQLAERAAHVDVYQRTAGWVVPRRDRTYHRWERFAFAHIPGYLRLTRAGMYWIRELYGIGFGYRPDLLRSAERVARRHIERQVHDPALRAAVTPTFHIGCKRILLANDWYPALQRSNVELITNPISQVRPAGIVTADGTVRDVDAIVAATGFHVTDSPTADLIKGADGRTLGEHRREFGQRAYKGTTVAGFPNFFSLVGPNTGVGHTSLLYMIESQINYVLDALDVMDRLGLGSVEVRQDVQDAYNEELQRRMRRTVWMTGCASWYLDAEGRNTTLWPRFTFAFRKITRHFDVSAYRTTPRAD